MNEVSASSSVYIGKRVLFFDRVGSTNSLAAEMARDPANDGVAILAREQTAGRGQQGRSWMCQPDLGVLLSVLIFPPEFLRRPVILAAWAANAVCETIRRLTGLEAAIKWPNDVLISGRKVCGILIEQGHGTVIGVGLNVKQSLASLQEMGLPDACSLACFLDEPASVEVRDVALELIAELDRQYAPLLDQRFSPLEQAWRLRSGLMGRRVTVECQTAKFEGRLRHLSFDCVELDEVEDGRLKLQPEMVKHIFLETI
jgi:BirA family biotin operon repressor/biotin-[acetyl-CoA-carboxylase] ligase